MASKSRVHAFNDVVKHSTREDCWLLIHGKVYDVTSFLEEHPGGEEVILAATEKDASDDFDDVGHSEDAKNLMQKYYVGVIDDSSLPTDKKFQGPVHVTEKTSQNESTLTIKLLQFLLPLLILGVAFALRYAIKKD